MLSGENKIKKEHYGKYDTAAVWLLLLIFDASVLLMLLLYDSIRMYVLICMVPVIENAPIKYVLSYIDGNYQLITMILSGLW